MRKECKQCPWKLQNRHSVNWRQNILNLIKSGWRKDKEHNCHMISPVWGETNKTNICIGSKNICHDKV